MMPDPNSLYARVGALVRAAGVDNFRIENNILVMCGVRYEIERCACDDPMCNGLRLRRFDGDADTSIALQ
ncbi:MAG TPA: hypothetical protein VFX27_09245 [Sphingobium sp.]|nr:hypothetical protein [Sphingobium sp.]